MTVQYIVLVKGKEEGGTGFSKGCSEGFPEEEGVLGAPMRAGKLWELIFTSSAQQLLDLL